MSYEIYFEAQDEGSALCGQHAINNLLQGAYFTAIDLGHIGSRLDEQEQNLLFSIDEDEKLSEESQSTHNNNLTTNNAKQRKYSNVSMEGLFSVDVLLSALKQIEIDALPLSHPSCTGANEHPDQEQGFIFYQMSHWIAYRKINNIWYDLNSQSNYLLLDPQPVHITEFYLSAQISKLQDEGFQVYVIRGNYPSLGRYAPKSNDLSGEYAWYSAQDIQSHVVLMKQSQRKQAEEQRIKTKQLMLHDPQQYNALMRHNMNNNYDNYNSFPMPDAYGTNIPPEYQMYNQQQQWLALQQYQNKQNGTNKTSDTNNSQTLTQNGIMSKISISNPFSKLKKIYQEKTKELKTKRNGSISDSANNPQQYLSDLEKAKQESLKTAQKQMQNNNNNNNVILSNNTNDFSDLNSPQIATYPMSDNHVNYGQTQHRVTYNNNNNNNNLNSCAVVRPPNQNQTQLAANSTDDDIKLAMALSASIANKTDNKNKLPQPQPQAKKENIELEFEMTDHKPKIVRKAQVQVQQQDFLDLMSMSNDINKNNNTDSNTEVKDMILDDNDPFTSLIEQYSNGHDKKQDINNNNNDNNVKQVQFEDNLFDFSSNNKKKNMEQVQFENNLFGDNTSSDVMDLMDNGKVKNHMVTPKDQNNPLISPNNNNTNGNFTYNNDAQRMENDLWLILEKSLTEQPK